MAAEREVGCPSCGTTRTTKASRSTRITCLGCGELFAAPAPRSGPGEGEDGGAAGGGAQAPPAPTGVTVERADGVKIGQVARPRARGTKKAAAGPPKEPLDGRHELATPDEHPAKRLGARGGRGVYGGVVARGRRR